MSIQVSSWGGAFLFFALLLSALATAFALARRALQRRSLAGPARWFAAALGAYVLILLGSGLAARDDVRAAPGVEKCFDDWCVSVASARVPARGAAAPPRRIEVELRIANHARRQDLAGDRPGVYLFDGQGRSYAARPDADAPGATPLSVHLPAGATALTRAVFEVPGDADGLGVWVREGPPFLVLIPGEERAPFHGRVLLQLAP